VAINPSDDAFATGGTASPTFPTTSGAFQTALAAGATSNAYLSELNPTGTGLLYGTYLGGGGSDTGNALAVDAAADVVLIGNSTSTNFPTTAGALQTANQGGQDAFVTRLAAGGSTLSYSSYLGGSGTDAGTGVATDALGNSYLAGYTDSTNFPAVHAFQTSLAGLGTYGAWVSALIPRPAPPAFTGISPDTGSSSSDQITDSQNLTLSGTAAANATVTLSRSDLGVIGTTTANGSGSWSFSYTGTTLPEGIYAFTGTATVSNVTSDPSPAFLVTVDLTPPAVTLTAPATTTSKSPVVPVTASDNVGLPSGATVSLDVDLNNDGNFTDAGETGYASGTLGGGPSGGQVAIVVPALPGAGTYPMRARVSDLAGNQGTSATATVVVTSATAWSVTGQVLSADPLHGDAELLMADAQVSVPLDLDQNPGTALSGDAALVYNSDSVSVKPVVQATLHSPNNATLPTSVSAVLTFGGTAGATLTYSTAGLAAGDTFLIAAQAGSNVPSTGRYEWSLHLWATGSFDQTLTGYTFVVVQDGSPFGAGLTFSLPDRLYVVSASGSDPAGVYRVYGTGGWRFYQGSTTFTSLAGDPGTLTLSGGVYTYTLPDCTTWTFNSSGYETQWTSPDGASVLTFSYDGSGNVTGMTAIDGTLTTFTYVSGKVSSLVTGNSRTTTLALDSNSNLTQVTNPDGGLHTFSYDGAAHHMTGETFGGLQNAWAYVTSGALATLTWGSGAGGSATGLAPAWVVGLSAAARAGSVAGTTPASTTDALGRTTAWLLNAVGQWVQATAGDGGVTQYAYNAGGYVTAVTDPLGRTTTYQRDAQGYATQVTFPDGSTQQFAYSADCHLLTTFTNERNDTTTYAYDNNDRLTSLTDALHETTAYAYTTAGLLQSATDPLNHTTSYAYDGSRRLTKVTDPLGDVTSFSYDANGNPLTMTDPRGNVTSYAYDVMSRLLQETDALSDVTSYTYDVAGLPLTTTDALGRLASTVYDAAKRGLPATQRAGVGTQAQASTLTSYDLAGEVSATRNADGWWSYLGYDPAGRPNQTTDALGGVTRTVYDLAGEVMATRDELGRWTHYAYNLRGWLTKVTDALGDVSTMAYDAAGNLTSATDPLSHTRSYQFDPLDRQTVATDGLGHAVTTAFDAAGRTSTVTDELGDVTAYGYDAADRQTLMTEAQGTGVQRTTTYAYDKAGNETSMTDPLLRIWSYAYDQLNRGTAATDPLGHTVTTGFDKVGNAVTRTDALNKVTTTAYDALDRATLVTDPLAHTTRTVLDAVGNAVGGLDGAGDFTRGVFDPLNRQLATVDGRGGLTRNLYDAASNPVSLVDPAGNATGWVYDGLNRAVKQTDPLGNVTSTAYHTAGRVTSVTDRDSRVVTYAYDAADRQTGATWKAASGAVTNVLTFSYDAKGNQLTAASYAGTYSNGYDALDRLTAQTNPFGQTLTYSYDAGGEQTAVQYSVGGVLTSVYDSAGRLTTREFGGSGQTPLRFDLGYTNRDQLSTITRYSDLAGTQVVGTTAYSYDDAGRATSIVHKNASAATLSYYTYGYDSADRVTQEVRWSQVGTTTYSGTRNYSYDVASELTGDGTATYTYDLNGNRTMTGYQTGAGNEVSNDGTWTYTYDSEGNLTEKTKGSGLETWYYGYDNANHLTSVRQTSDGSNNELLVTYTYDVYGQRIEEDKWTSGTGTVTTRFAWDGGQVWAELDGSNAVKERYLWGDTVDQLFARIDGNGTAWWYLTDLQGSVRDVLNASGVVQDHVDYSGFGVIITSEANATARGRYGWQGADYDPQTGLQYHRARYYSPSAGTWTSQDPIAFGAGDANLYRYGGNSPTNATDPSGKIIVIDNDPSIINYVTTNLDEMGLNFYPYRLKDGRVVIALWNYTPPDKVIDALVADKEDDISESCLRMVLTHAAVHSSTVYVEAPSATAHVGPVSPSADSLVFDLWQAMIEGGGTTPVNAGLRTPPPQEDPIVWIASLGAGSFGFKAKPPSAPSSAPRGPEDFRREAEEQLERIKRKYPGQENATGMAISRAKALERLEGLAPQVEKHLEKIAQNPGHSSIPHWSHEVSNWLDQMEAMLPHVGKKTAADWAAKINQWRQALPPKP
jgi:RHS repeat-associated protein